MMLVDRWLIWDFRTVQGCVNASRILKAGA